MGSNQTTLTGAFETFIGNELGAFNGSLPQNYTTTHADTMVIGASQVGFGGVPAAANNGFAFTITPVSGGFATLYKVLTATGTAVISHDQDNLTQSMVGCGHRSIQWFCWCLWYAGHDGSTRRCCVCR
jgi:hypothetical protein